MWELRRRVAEESTADRVNGAIKNIHNEILERLAPERVFIMRRENQIINSALEALKKKKNRMIKKYRKTDSGKYLLRAQILSKKLKKEINKTERETIQKKANSPNAKTFWSMIAELREGRKDNTISEICTEEGNLREQEEIANAFGEYFENKIGALEAQAIVEESMEPTFGAIGHLETNHVEVALIARTIKGKKSSGIDNIPQCIVKETEPYLRTEYMKLFNLAMRSIPTEWKMAKVSPIHKKGEVTSVV